MLIIGLVSLFCCTQSLIAQNKAKSISAVILDELGDPISGANIYGAKGVSATSDSTGSFTINIPIQTSIVIEKDGFESQFLAVSELPSQVVLVKSLFHASSKDEVKMGFRTTTQREMVGAASIINPSDRLTYDNTQSVRDYIQGLLPGVRGSDNIRGLGGALFVIDGVIGRTPDILTMEEVDQITVLKDANAVALYGAQAKNGVIIIHTKRGKVNQKRAKVNVRYGIKNRISYPSYLNAPDYMELYNEARANDGLGQQYSNSLIENTRSGSNPYRYPDVNLYSDEYVRSTAQTVDVNTEFSGGTEKTRYYINMGYNYDQSWVKVNPQANSGHNQFNVRGNVDFKVNSFINSSIDAVAIIGSNKTANTNLLSAATIIKPNAYAPLLPVYMIDTMNNPVLAGQVAAAGIYDGMLLGSSQVYQENAPIADIIAGGYTNDMFRSTQFTNFIDFDLDMITDGLSAKTYLSFDLYDSYDISLNNKYRVYEPNWSGDKIIGLIPYGDVDQKDQTENANPGFNVTRFGFYGLLDYKKYINKDHYINATLIAYTDDMNRSHIIQSERNSHLGLQLSYDYKKKLFLDFSGAYIYSIKLPEGNRGGFSPTGGVAYILSEEDFIKNISFIDYLKVKATGGLIKSDIGIEEYYLYSGTYAQGTQVSWNDGGQRNNIQEISQGANDRMTFEERLDMNLGLETYLMNALYLEFNYFNSSIDKQLTTLNSKYPSYYDPFKPYDNFNKDSYKGFELAMNYTKKINDLKLSVGGNIMHVKSEAVKRDEVFKYGYQYLVGQPVNSIYGLSDDGFYKTSDFTIDVDGNYVLNKNLPVPSYGIVQPGDIKYVDKNNDNVIDNNDMSYIGNLVNPWSYGLNLKLNYKGVSLFVLCRGQFGGDGLMNGDYYWVQGDKKYSDVVLNSWTPETANTATYPRLTSGASSNNFQTSTFWTYNNSFFDIQRVQLTYEFSKSFCKKMKMKNLSVNIAGSNIFRIAKNRDVQQLNVKGNPQFRHFTFGIRTSF